MPKELTKKLGSKVHANNATVFIAAPAEAGKDSDVRKMQGTWRAIKIMDGGRMAPKKQIEITRVVFEKGDMVFTAGPRRRVMGQDIKLNAKESPRAMDLTLTDRDGDGRTALGIYTFDGDQLTILLNEAPGGKRPTKFAAKTTTRKFLPFLLVLKREKPEHSD